MAERSRRRQITADELVAINRATADHAHRVVIVHVDQQVSDINPPSAFTVARHDRRN